jgi:hypothetical protein
MVFSALSLFCHPMVVFLATAFRCSFAKRSLKTNVTCNFLKHNFQLVSIEATLLLGMSKASQPETRVCRAATFSAERHWHGLHLQALATNSTCVIGVKTRPTRPGVTGSLAKSIPTGKLRAGRLAAGQPGRVALWHLTPTFKARSGEALQPALTMQDREMLARQRSPKKTADGARCGHGPGVGSVDQAKADLAMDGIRARCPGRRSGRPQNQPMTFPSSVATASAPQATAPKSPGAKL